MATPLAAVESGILALGRVNKAIGSGLCWTAAAFVAIMTAVVLLGVFFRYVLNNSLGWSEETAILMMIWVAFLVAPFAYRSGGNVAIDMFVSALPQRALTVLRIIINLLVLWLLYRFLMEAALFVERGLRVRANTLDIPIGYVRAIVPVSMVAMMAVAVELILRDVWSFFVPGRAMEPPHLAEPIEPE